MSKPAYRIAHKTQAIKTPGQDKARLRQHQAAHALRFGLRFCAQAKRRGG